MGSFCTNTNALHKNYLNAIIIISTLLNFAYLAVLDSICLLDISSDQYNLYNIFGPMMTYASYTNNKGVCRGFYVHSVTGPLFVRSMYTLPPVL